MNNPVIIPRELFEANATWILNFFMFVSSVLVVIARLPKIVIALFAECFHRSLCVGTWLWGSCTWGGWRCGGTWRRCRAEPTRKL